MLLFHHLHFRPVLMPGLDEPWVIIPMMYRIHFIPIVRLVINILVEVVYVLEVKLYKKRWGPDEYMGTRVYQKNAGYQTHRWSGV